MEQRRAAALHRPAGPGDNRRDHTFFYQYKADRAWRTLKGIDTQVTKVEKPSPAGPPVKRNRYIRLTGATKSVNRALEAKNRALAGIKGYVTNLPNLDPQQVVGAGSSNASSPPPAATGRSRSRPASTRSPPPTPSHGTH